MTDQPAQLLPPINPPPPTSSSVPDTPPSPPSPQDIAPPSVEPTPPTQHTAEAVLPPAQPAEELPATTNAQPINIENGPPTPRTKHAEDYIFGTVLGQGAFGAVVEYLIITVNQMLFSGCSSHRQRNRQRSGYKNTRKEAHNSPQQTEIRCD